MADYIVYNYMAMKTNFLDIQAKYFVCPKVASCLHDNEISRQQNQTHILESYKVVDLVFYKMCILILVQNWEIKTEMKRKMEKYPVYIHLANLFSPKFQRSPRSFQFSLALPTMYKL